MLDGTVIATLNYLTKICGLRIMITKTRECLLVLICLFIGISHVNGQQVKKTVLKGIVVDGQTNSPIPAAAVVVESTTNGVTEGTTTDSEGNFLLSTNIPNPSLRVSRVGYETEIVKIFNGSTDLIKVSLTSSLTELDEVVVKARKVRYRNKNNPAVSLIDSVIANKDNNRNENFDFLKYGKYDKVQFAISNISESVKKSKALKKFRFVFDNIDTTKQPGKEVLPLYIKETISDCYYRKSPKASKEIILADKMVDFKGYLSNEGITAYLRYLYQNINIYDNNVIFLTNQFLSPIAKSAPIFYRYYIVDTVDIADIKCARLFFTPRNKTDMLFQGYMFITLDGSYALRKIDMGVNKNINLNWVKDVKIAQEFENTLQQGWVLTNDEFSVDFGFNQNGLGIFGQRSVTYKNYEINKEINDNLFSSSSPKLDEVQKSDAYWEENRFVQLTQSEQGIYSTMDSLQQVPAFKRTMDAFRIAIAGFHDFGPFEIGPIATFYSYNQIEGTRIKFGGRTTPKLNKKLIFDGYLAYGFKDKKYKYNIGASYSFTDKTVYDFPVKSLKLNYQQDTKIPGQELYFVQEGNALMSVKRGVDDKLFYNRTFKAEYLNEFENHFSYALGYNYTRQSPGGSLKFSPIDISEVSLNLRYAPHEKFYQGKMFRDPVTSKYPVLQFKFTNGSKLIGNDYNYSSFKLSISKKFFPALIGYTAVTWEAGKLLGEVPYPLLTIHNANQTYYYQSIAYNLMNFLEFVSDQYTSLNVDHCFNGFIFNKLPLIKKLSLREIVTCKVLYGGLSKSNNPDFNSDLMKFPVDKYGNPTTFALGGKPYVEVGFGISNIFRFIRIDFVQRLTYLDHPNVSKTGVRMMFKFDI